MKKALSKKIRRRRDAWDGNLALYAGGLIAAGCVIGLVFLSGRFMGVAGIYAGQILVIGIKSGGDLGLLPLGLIALAAFTGLSAAGGFFCAPLRKK